MSEHAAVSRKDLEKYAVFLFGVIFLIAILSLVVLNPKPTLAQFFVFRLTLALASAGVGALMPGFIHFQQEMPYRGLVRCGGALALFAAVWFTNPAQFAIEGLSPPPIEDATAYIEGFLAVSDKNDQALAYSLFADHERASISAASYAKLVGNVRTPLGERKVGPILWNAANPNQIPGRTGPFVFHAYQSTFKGKPGVWVEIAGVVAEEGKWKMHTYTVGPCSAPNCLPLDQLR